MTESAARRLLILIASTRSGGNAETLAKAAVDGLPPGAEVRWQRRAALSLPPFEDIRHNGDGQYPAPTGDLARLLDDTLWATGLVIATPLYCYSLATPLKLYLDHWSAFLRVPGLEFKARMAGKTMFVLCATSSGDEPHLAQPLVDSLRYSAELLQMRWGGHVLGDGSRPGDVLKDATALQAAAQLLAG